MLWCERNPTFTEQERGLYQRVGGGWQLAGSWSEQWMLTGLRTFHGASPGSVILTWRLLEDTGILLCFIAS